MRNFSLFLLLFVVFYSTKAQTTVPTFCDLPKDEGTGLDTDVRVYLYYNKTADKCYPFRYKGQGGNGNRFTAEKYCMRNCSARAEDVYPVDRTKACHLPRTPGDCYGNYLRFYYDPVHEKCKAFSWTGCVGNGNRFLDIQRCNSTCFGIKDEGRAVEDVESDTPVGIILGVVLGIIGAIILIVVLVLTLKKKPSPKQSKAKAKEEPSSTDPGTLLPNDRIEMA